MTEEERVMLIKLGRGASVFDNADGDTDDSPKSTKDKKAPAGKEGRNPLVKLKFYVKQAKHGLGRRGKELLTDPDAEPATQRELEAMASAFGMTLDELARVTAPAGAVDGIVKAERDEQVVSMVKQNEREGVRLDGLKRALTWDERLTFPVTEED